MEMIEKTCKNCGKKKYVLPCYAKSSKGFCNLKCVFEYQRGENAPRWNGGLTKKYCLICNDAFEVEVGRKFTAKYCSTKCAGKATQKPGTKVKCDTCHKIFHKSLSSQEQTDHNFCSVKCYRGFNTNKNHWKYSSKLLNCDTCGKEIKVIKSRRVKNKNHFCSVKCSNIRTLGTKKINHKKIKKYCFFCNNAFEVYPCDERVRIVKYCSWKCFYKSKDHDSFKLFWKNPTNKRLYNYFKGILFGKGYEPSKLDKEIIQTRVGLFKLNQQLKKEVTQI